MDKKTVKLVVVILAIIAGIFILAFTLFFLIFTPSGVTLTQVNTQATQTSQATYTSSVTSS